MAKDKVESNDTATVRKKRNTAKYINPLTDFGFKYIFGDKASLLAFLNAIQDTAGKKP